jgi:hypothetical protein
VALLLAASIVLPQAAFGAATIVIQNGDPAGVGFNDATPVAPVGGNTGTTLGEQRLIAVEAAANKWGATLTSVTTITVFATWEALGCDETSGILGRAGAITAWRDFTGAGVAGTLYGVALANKQFGADIDVAAADIRARFNVDLGNPGCLTGTFFYLGLDNNHGADVDLVGVATHELAHGLGFQTFTDGSTGAQLDGPTIYDDFILDTTTAKHWNMMTDAERVTSAVNTNKLVWDGANVTAAVPQVLALGMPRMTISAPASVAGKYDVGTADFGPALSSPGVTAEVMRVVDTAPDLGLACDPLSTLNAAAVSGKIGLIDRGICTFVVKVKNAQDAGAVGVILADNAPGSPPPGLGGTDATITIPTVSITQADGATLKAALATRSRLHSGMMANLDVDLAIRAGADASGRALLYAPNPFQTGMSIGHWDTSAFPNQIMEPALNDDEPHEVTPPVDMTFPLLKDLGW